MGSPRVKEMTGSLVVVMGVKIIVLLMTVPELGSCHQAWSRRQGWGCWGRQHHRVQAVRVSCEDIWSCWSIR